MHYSKLAELEEIQMDILFEALKCKREGDLRRFYSKIAIVKHLNAFLNKGEHLQIYDEFFRRGIENFELGEEKAKEFLEYGEHKAKRIIDLVENPLEFINKNLVSAKDFLKEHSTQYPPLDFFSLN